jgi:hypothetical protein
VVEITEWIEGRIPAEVVSVEVGEARKAPRVVGLLESWDGWERVVVRADGVAYYLDSLRRVEGDGFRRGFFDVFLLGLFSQRAR